MEAVVEKFVKYFKSIYHHNSWYFAYFILCKYLYMQSSNPCLFLSPIITQESLDKIDETTGMSLVHGIKNSK